METVYKQEEMGYRQSIGVNKLSNRGSYDSFAVRLVTAHRSVQ